MVGMLLPCLPGSLEMGKELYYEGGMFNDAFTDLSIYRNPLAIRDWFTSSLCGFGSYQRTTIYSATASSHTSQLVISHHRQCCATIMPFQAQYSLACAKNFSVPIGTVLLAEDEALRGE